MTVTFNRPAAKNALNLETLARLADAWTEIEEDSDIRVAILTGNGGVFSAGADLKEMHGDQTSNPWHDRFNKEKGGDPELHWKAFLRSKLLKKPLVAAVEGVAFAGGMEILQGTDIRVAGASAKFGLTEAKRGLFPLGGSTVRLRRQVPYTKALEILLLGEPFGAQEALDMGLIGRVVPDGEALNRPAAWPASWQTTARSRCRPSSSRSAPAPTCLRSRRSPRSSRSAGRSSAAKMPARDPWPSRRSGRPTSPASKRIQTPDGQ